jgi:hypothetical protein
MTRSLTHPKKAVILSAAKNPDAAHITQTYRTFQPRRSRELLLLITSVAFLINVPSVSAETIRVRVLNGRNGKPVVHEKVSVFIKGDRDAADHTTDSNGTFTLDLDPLTEPLPSTGWWITCRTPQPAAPHLFSVQTIHDDGIVDENTCGKVRSEPIRGTLTIFARRATLFENMAR